MMKSSLHSASCIGSAQELINVTPDLIALGKIIGGGLPIGAYGGRQEIMEKVAPLGPAYQAGTMAGNPASMLAGIACLEVLQEEGVYEHLDHLGAMLEKGILEAAAKFNAPITVNRLRGALSIYFTNEKVVHYEQAEATNGDMFATFFNLMLNQGINIAPSKYEAWFMTIAHTADDIKETIAAIEQAFSEMY